jgi:hypothetical protein
VTVLLFPLILIQYCAPAVALIWNPSRPFWKVDVLLDHVGVVCPLAV